MNTTQRNELPTRRATWAFGPFRMRCRKEAAWWRRHEPTVDRWLTEMEAVRDPWWQSAEHAAFCLVSRLDSDYGWDDFEVSPFLFGDLSEGGTVGIFGSVEVFFDQLVDALRRFVADGLIPAVSGERWLDEMRGARADFLRYYDPTISEREAMTIARRRCRSR